MGEGLRARALSFHSWPCRSRGRARGTNFIAKNAPSLGYIANSTPMAEAAKTLFLIVSALFPIVDPLGGSPIFLLMTREYSSSTRRALSWRIAINSFFLLIGSYFIGTHILSFFGISLPVVQVGGGLIVISTGWTLLKQGSLVDQKNANQNLEPQDPFHNAFYPLTLPLTVGPGSISVAITLGANAPSCSRDSPHRYSGPDFGCLLLAVSIFLR